jgi:hypothetical protein
MADEMDERNEILDIPVEQPEPGGETREDLFAEPATVVNTADVIPAQPVKVDRAVIGGMFGIPEIAAIAVSAIVLLCVVGFYFLIVAPADRDLKAKKDQRDQVEAKLKETQDRFKQFGTTEAAVTTLNQSVENFEYNYLPVSSVGRMQLYDRINGLMAAYDLRNTAGPEYSPLGLKEFKPDEQQKERGRAQFETLFPGVYINMTVEGSYVNIRRFIRDIEAGGQQQFVVISMVQLEASENNEGNKNAGAPPQNQQQGQGPNFNPSQTGVANKGLPPGMGGAQQPGQQSQLRPSQRGKTHGEIVSLHMELAAYFRRENQPMIAAPAADQSVK